MAQSFCCFVEIDGQKYDIIINEDIISVGFEDIYQKIQQIIKLMLKQDICFATHIFEVFDNNSSKGVVIQGFNSFVKHLSTIRIHCNPVVSPRNSITPFNPNLLPIRSTPLPFVPSIPTLNTSKRAGDDCIPHHYYCKVCPNYIYEIDPRLTKSKYNLNSESYKRYSDLLTTIKEISESNCDEISDYQWINVIPHKMSAFRHKDFSPKLWKSFFEVFLQKYIEAMDVSPDRYLACSLFPFLHEYNAFQFKESNPYYKRITELRQKLKITSHESVTHKRNTSSPYLREKSKFEKQIFRRLVLKMMEEEEDIKVFHFIVQLVKESQLDFKPKDRKTWEWVSGVLIKYGYSSRSYSTSNCEDKFLKWSAWYAQNYSKLNGYLEPKEQEVFDLLKIVHILNFTKFWKRKNFTLCSLKKISHKSDVKLYLNDFENRKLVLKRINRKDKKDCHNSPKSSSKSDTITEKDSNSVAIDLQNNNKNNESVIYCYPDVRARRAATPSQPSLPSVEKSQTIISSQTERNNILIPKKKKSPKNVVNKDFVSFVHKLKSNENIIQTFHEMIVEMNIGWNFKDNPNKYWKVLADKMCRTDSKYRYILTSDICKTRFYLWTRFYAQNYDKYNGKLEPKLQKIYDCLKLVHTLDLKQLFSSESSTYIKIKDISLRKDFREYFNKHLNHIRIKKLVTRETEPNKDKSEDQMISRGQDNNCETTHSTLKVKISVKNRKDIQKTNIQNNLNKKSEKESDLNSLNKGSDSRVSSERHNPCEKQLNQNISNIRKEISKQPDFIPLSRASEPQNRIVMNRERLSEHSAKQLTDKPTNKDNNEIEVIDLD